MHHTSNDLPTLADSSVRPHELHKQTFIRHDDELLNKYDNPNHIIIIKAVAWGGGLVATLHTNYILRVRSLPFDPLS